MTSILDDAKKLIKNRDETHGNFYKNLQLTAKLWSAYLGVEIKVYDVTNMNNMQKISRSKTGKPAREHFADQAGYAELGYQSTRIEANDLVSMGIGLEITD
tara:strand:+ start:605 stop:907 length:303 start_codon:yes stop_codon:yes gene_type:complete